MNNHPTSASDPSGNMVVLVVGGINSQAKNPSALGKGHVTVLVWDPATDKGYVYDGVGPGLKAAKGPPSDLFPFPENYIPTKEAVENITKDLESIPADRKFTISDGKFADEFKRLESSYRRTKQVPLYLLKGINSNTWARQFVLNADIPVMNVPADFAPGWSYGAGIEDIFKYGGDLFSNYGVATPWLIYKTRLKTGRVPSTLEPQQTVDYQEAVKLLSVLEKRGEYDPKAPMPQRPPSPPRLPPPQGTPWIPPDGIKVINPIYRPGVDPIH